MGYTAQINVVADSSTYANFASWGSAVSAQILACGWAKTSDTGQAVWGATVLTITGVTVSAYPYTTYSYTTVSGSGPSVGNWLAITGMAHAGNNTANAQVISLGAGTFTLSLGGTTVAAETGTAVSASNSLFETWRPTDVLQTGSTKFFLKIVYAPGFSTPAGMTVTVQLGTGTDGAGNLTGLITPLYVIQLYPGHGLVLFECDISGDTNRLGMLLWRGPGFGLGALIAIERTKQTSGADSTDGVTLFCNNQQATIIFGVGIPIPGALAFLTIGTSQLWNNNVAVSPVFPVYGKFGNPHTVLCVANTVDVAEGMLLTTPLYGVTRTYLFTKTVTANSGGVVGLRFD